MEVLVISILVLIGALLLTLEVAFIPGLGVTGVLGALAMIAAIAYSFVCINALAGWLSLAIVVLVIVVLIMWAIYGKSIDKIALNKNIDSTVKNPDSEALSVGDNGVALTRLALVGEAEFDGRIVEVVSSGGFIEEKANITIVRISGSSVFVAETPQK